MPIKVQRFGTSRTDKVVMEWMKRNGIDPNLVSSYSILRNADSFSTITLTMHFNDDPEGENNG